MASLQRRPRLAPFGNIEARSTYRSGLRRAQNCALALVEFIRPTRVVMVLVSMLAIALPSRPSQACFSRTEVSHHFLTSYLYSHGLDGCWDGVAPPSVRHAIRKKDPPIREVLPDREAAHAAAAAPSDDRAEHDSPPIAPPRTAAPQVTEPPDAAAVAPVTARVDVPVTPPPATPPPSEQPIAHEAEPSAGTASTATVGRSTPLADIAPSDEPIHRPRNTMVASLSAIGAAMAAAVAIGLMESKRRRSYATRILRFSAMVREHELPSSRQRRLSGRSSSSG